ncbi:MAG: hypothetical protein M3N46_07960, partial [Actinomycetota bacterium]|nr:hypothetical protein [Actinomycetota bacterium]
PKPGLIPLRPLTLGTILGAAFQTLRRNPGATLAPALILTMIVAVIQALGSAGFLTQYLGAVTDLGTSSGSVSFSSGSSVPAGLLSGGVGLVATSLVSSIFTLIVTAIVAGIVTLQVASSTLGSRLRLGGLWGRLSGRRGALIGWALLSAAVVLVALGVVFGLLVLLGSTGSAGVGIAVLLGLVLGAGLVVISAWLWVKLGFVPAALVLERTSIRLSMARSWALTRGSFWRIFGIRLLVLAMISVATQIVAGPISLIFSLGGTVLSPNGASTTAATNSLVLSLIVTQGVTAIVSAVGLVVSSATTSLLYLDRRMRLEGLDLDLAGYVERRQSGEQGLPDPYRTPGDPVGAV